MTDCPTCCSDVKVLTVQVDHLSSNFDQMREALCNMAEAVNKLAVVEERQAATTEAIAKIVDKLDKVDERLRSLEISEPTQARAADWVYRALWSIAAAAAAYIASKTGLI